MPNLIYPTQDQMQIIVNNETGVLIELLRPQPPEGYKYKKIILDVDENSYAYFTKRRQNYTTKLSYPSGTYRVKETWDEGFARIMDDVEQKRYVVYKADFSGEELEIVKNIYDFKSSRTMKAKDIRFELDIETTVKRVQNIRPRDVLKMGIDEDKYTAIKKRWTNCIIGQDKGFADYYNSLHAKPVKCKDKDEYECFPYDRESFLNTLKFKDGKHEVMEAHCMGFFQWKGKKLNIDPNAWIALLKFKRREVA